MKTYKVISQYFHDGFVEIEGKDYQPLKKLLEEKLSLSKIFDTITIEQMKHYNDDLKLKVIIYTIDGDRDHEREIIVYLKEIKIHRR